MSQNSDTSASLWPHRFAVVLACATTFLLWIGALVTTTDAGMAVEDWPTTFGYNMFLYPWSDWLAAQWDLFVEHGHRLFASAVGLLTIALSITLWRSDQRRWVRWLGIAALGLVIFQGVLGGVRVLLDERTLAMLHGCTGPLFLTLVAALVVFTSESWRQGVQSAQTRPGQFGSLTIKCASVLMSLFVYLQIFYGATIRHVSAETSPASFAIAIRHHLWIAGVLTLLTVLLAIFVLHGAWSLRPLRRLSLVLSGLVGLQIALGASTWIVKFAVPTWAPGWVSAGEMAIADGGWLQTHVVTAHVVVGSLMLATSTSLTLYAFRLLPRHVSSSSPGGVVYARKVAV